MNVAKLNEHISGNKDAIETILENLNCIGISYNRQHESFRFGLYEGKNPTGNILDINSLKFTSFSSSAGGSIYSLIMLKKGKTFPEALKWAARSLKIDENELNMSIKLPFGGFYKHINKAKEEPESMMQTYSEQILEQFGHVCTTTFLKDGISLQTQEKFKLGYDMLSDRITIPQWNFNGELVGIMGRSNDPQIPHSQRWFPIIPCSRGHTLFGFHQNYAKIQQQQTCVIVEGEKGVMQLSSMGYNIGLATCTKSISSVQARYLKALRVDKYIIAYDEGVTENELRHEAEKIKIQNHICDNKVGFIFDTSNQILQEGSKCSPTDLGQAKFKELVQKHVIWI